MVENAQNIHTHAHTHNCSPAPNDAEIKGRGAIEKRERKRQTIAPAKPGSDDKQQAILAHYVCRCVCASDRSMKEKVVDGEGGK